jgi:hypothetical protein
MGGDHDEGLGQGADAVPPSVTWRLDCMASSSADWVLGGVRLISSAQHQRGRRSARAGSGRRPPLVEPLVPVTSAGSRSGVNRCARIAGPRPWPGPWRRASSPPRAGPPGARGSRRRCRPPRVPCRARRGPARGPGGRAVRTPGPTRRAESRTASPNSDPGLERRRDRRRHGRGVFHGFRGPGEAADRARRAGLGREEEWCSARAVVSVAGRAARDRDRPARGPPRARGPGAGVPRPARRAVPAAGSPGPPARIPRPPRPVAARGAACPRARARRPGAVPGPRGRGGAPAGRAARDPGRACAARGTRPGSVPGESRGRPGHATGPGARTGSGPS